MGSPATKLAAETELAETMREPTTGVGGRSVDWTLPAADAGASPMAASSAPRPDENAIPIRMKNGTVEHSNFSVLQQHLGVYFVHSTQFLSTTSLFYYTVAYIRCNVQVNSCLFPLVQVYLLADLQQRNFDC